MTYEEKKVVDQIKHLHTYLSCLQQEEDSDTSNVNQALAALHEKGINSKVKWIFHSGATHHMIGNLKLFHEYNCQEKKKFIWWMELKFL